MLAVRSDDTPAGDEAAHSAGESVLLVRRHRYTRTTPSTSSTGPASDAATNTATATHRRWHAHADTIPKAA